MKRWYYIFAALAVASAIPSQKAKDCLENCKCKENFPTVFQITECTGPLTINETTFSFLNKKQTSVISISDVIIDDIKEGAFKGFQVLEDVIIERCQIGSIDSKAFDPIRKVKFSDCGFEDSPDLYSEKIEQLHFGNCKLDRIPALDELFSLTFLNLSGNYIKDIDIVTFAELFDLEELILSNNEIVKLPANLFVNNQELNSLYLDNNPLKYFYLNVTNNLETLSLKNCLLTTFDERSTQKLRMLNELNLSNNKITNLSGKNFSHLSQLSVLDLSNNSITKLDSDIFVGNPELQKVILDGNKLENLPNFTLANHDVFKIITFSCNNCGLTRINKNAFKNMLAIINLQLAHNNFTNVENMFDYINSLRMLDISYNNIAVIGPKAFAYNRNLENLNLGGNPLLALNPDLFESNHALKRLDVSNAKLYKLWTNNNTILESLRTLVVSNNQLTTLSVDDFRVVPNLQAIDLHNNPLQFDTSLCKVINWLEHLAVFPFEYSEALEELEENFDNNALSFNSWSEFHNKKCPKPLSDFETLIDDTEESKQKVVEQSYDSTPDYPYDDYYDDEGPIIAESVKDDNITLASYILSVTSVFVLTALVVLTFAVTITLCILRRNSSFNMRQANLPRLKIPLWDTTPAQKKHSGSVYRPLSEDLSGPKTPKLSRYEFKAQPTIHTT